MHDRRSCHVLFRSLGTCRRLGRQKNIGGLINVSPTVKTGDINLLSGLLNGPILSGNGLDVLNIGGGILNILNTNDSGKKRRR